MGDLVYRSRSVGSISQLTWLAVIAIIIGSAIALAVNFALSGDEQWTNENIATSRARAETIIAALESFRKQHGAYPAELSELMPGILTEIPPPTAGLDRWKYERPAPAEFWLGFAADDTWYPYAAYRSDRGWIVDQ